MRTAATILLLALCLVGADALRTLSAATPTEQLNAQRQQQQRQEQQRRAAQQAAALQRRLQPPCFVPDTYYPTRTCRLSQNATECGRGFNAWANHQQCCAKQNGPVGAFPEGCTDFTREVTCFIADTFYPRQTCKRTSGMDCQRNWGRWISEADCCAPGAAFEAGCSKPDPCWAASTFWPARTCGLTEDQTICQRGWGAFPSEQECCLPGGGFSDGCSAAVEIGDNEF